MSRRASAPTVHLRGTVLLRDSPGGWEIFLRKADGHQPDIERAGFWGIPLLDTGDSLRTIEDLLGLEEGRLLSATERQVESIRWGPAPRYELGLLCTVLGEGESQVGSLSCEQLLESTNGFILVTTALTAYRRCARSGGPPLHCIPEVHWLLCSLEREHRANAKPLSNMGFGFDGLERYHMAGGVVSVPLLSATTPPFDCTNLIALYQPADDSAVSSLEEAVLALPSPVRLVVTDPGYNRGSEQDIDMVWDELVKLSGCSPDGSDVLVFLTHEHHDHHEGTPQLLQRFPKAMMLVHEGIRQRLFGEGAPGQLWPLQSSATTHSDASRAGLGPAIRIGVEGQASSFVHLAGGKGHTSSHTCLFLPSPHNVLLAGDHVVGYGSAVLDPDSGDIAEYLTTTQYLVDLKPAIGLPAHGRPLLQPVAVLRHYHAHRLKREEAILRAVQQLGEEGTQASPVQVNMAAIVAIVYATTPKELWPAAQRNVRLHVQKLMVEDRLGPEVSLCLDVAKI